MICKQCTFFKPPGPLGLCQRYPPSKDGFPLVDEDTYWCGEFKQKELPRPEYLDNFLRPEYLDVFVTE